MALSPVAAVEKSGKGKLGNAETARLVEYFRSTARKLFKAEAFFRDPKRKEIPYAEGKSMTLQELKDCENGFLLQLSLLKQQIGRKKTHRPRKEGSKPYITMPKRLSDQFRKFLDDANLGEEIEDIELVTQDGYANPSLLMSILQRYIEANGLKDPSTKKIRIDARMKKYLSDTRFIGRDGKELKLTQDVLSRAPPEVQDRLKEQHSRSKQSPFEILRNEKDKNGKPYVDEDGNLNNSSIMKLVNMFIIPTHYFSSSDAPSEEISERMQALQKRISKKRE